MNPTINVRKGIGIVRYRRRPPPPLSMVRVAMKLITVRGSTSAVEDLENMPKFIISEKTGKSGLYYVTRGSR